MRVSTRMLSEATLINIRHAHSRIRELQSQISSGRRVQLPSDDPTAASRSLRARSGLRANEQWSQNLSSARAFVVATESRLSAVADLTAEVRTIATQAADESHTDDALASFAAHINGLLENALSEANAQHGGLRLFGGTETLQDPCVAERDAQGQIIAVATRTGSPPQGDMRRLVGENDPLVINTLGSAIFGENLEYFEDLIALRDALEAGDRAQVRELLPRFDENLERVSMAQSVNGVLVNRLDRLEDRLETQGIDLEATRSENEDLDVTEALIAYQSEQAVLEAALSVTSRTLEMTLAQFLQ